MNANITDKLIDLVKARLEKEDWVAIVENVENEPKQLRVTTVDKYVIVVEIDEDGTVRIIEEGLDDGEPYPSLILTQLPLEGTEKENIKIKAEAEVTKTSKTKKVTIVRIVKPESMKQEKEYLEGGVIFEVTENRVYTFEAETNMGKIKKKTIEINIAKPESDIEITSEPITPRNTKETGTQNGIAKGPIAVNITYGDNSFEKQYKIGTNGSWTNVTGTTASFNVTENVAIFARYSDGTNSFKTVTYNIQNVDNVAPNAFNVTETHTTNSITIGAETTDTASEGALSTIAGILRYEYRIYKNGAWEGWQTSNVFTGLATGTYKVQAKAIDKAGNETISSESANITLGTISTADITISSSPITPRNTGIAGTQNGIAKGPITVNITYGNSSYTRQYKIGTSGSWTNVAGTTASFNVTENVAIFARYFDGTNGFQTQAYNIQNVDNVAPNAFNVTETHTTNSITIGAETTDTASEGALSTIAGILRYEYRIYKNGAWEGWQTSNVFTGLATGTYKVQAKAIDKAGNETISSESANITLGTISTADITISSSPITPRNTGIAGTQNGIAKGPITVNITYGNSSYTRQYKIGTSGSWTNVAGTTASFNVTENVAIFARYFDGTNGFQTQAYNIQNVDNVAPTINSYNATVSKNVITATCTATDTASTGALNTTAGILRYEYSNGGTTYQTSNTFTVSTAGTYTIYMKAIDKAGNQTIVNKQVTVSSYIVTYNANGGTGAPSSQTAISGINLTLSSIVPTRSGYSFLGWSTDSNATTATYAAGATYTANVSTTLYAVWEAIGPIKKISFSGNATRDPSKTEEVTLEKGKYFFFVDGYSHIADTSAGAIVTNKADSSNIFSVKASKDSYDYDDIQIYYRYDIDITETTTFNVRVYGMTNSAARTDVYIYPASKTQSIVKEIEYKGKTKEYTITNSSGQVTGGGVEEHKSIYIPAAGYKVILYTIGSDVGSAPSYYCNLSTSFRSVKGTNVDILKKVSEEGNGSVYESTSAGWVTISNTKGANFWGTAIDSVTNPNGEKCSFVTTTSTGY